MGIFLFSLKQFLKHFYPLSAFFLCIGEEAVKTNFIGNSGFKLTKSERAPEPNHTSRQLRKETHYPGTNCKILICCGQSRSWRHFKICKYKGEYWPGRCVCITCQQLAVKIHWIIIAKKSEYPDLQCLKAFIWIVQVLHTRILGTPGRKKCFS